jgi:signal transduction histidine kinase/ActR/RegA family two-component response regulator
MSALHRALAEDEVELLFTMLDVGPVHMYVDRLADAVSPRRFLTTPNMKRLVGGRPADVDALFDLLDARVHPEDRARLAEARALSIGRQPVAAEVRLADDAGSWRWWRITSEARGEPLMLGFLWDITEAVDATEAEKAARADAEESRDRALSADRAKTELLSRMSHELRTPLNSIVGFGQLLALQDLASPERDWVSNLVVAGEHLRDLVDEALDVVGIQTGRLEVSVEPIEVAAIVDEAIGLLERSASERQVAIVHRDPPGTEVWALGDQTRVLQVLLAVLDNAIRYNRPSGSVSVTVAEIGDRIAVEVVDTGPGIDDGLVEQAFQPFDRLGVERTGVEGRGMGLTLARSLAERMQGTLEMSSAPGTGTTVRLELPVARAGEPPTDAALERPVAGAPAGRHTILYIEDNVANLRLMESVLELRPSVGLITAMRGKLGVDIARDQHPDLVLVDLHLPDMDGREVVRRLRSEPSTAGLPVVVVSADATPGRAEEILDLGVDHYVTKPIDIQELIAIFDRYLDGEGATDRG